MVRGKRYNLNTIKVVRTKSTQFIGAFAAICATAFLMSGCANTSETIQEETSCEEVQVATESCSTSSVSTKTQEPADNKEVITYNLYKNPRYEYSIEYPSYLSNRFNSDNGDGVKLTDESGKVSLIVSGINNILGTSLNDDYNRELQNIKSDPNNYKITYSSLLDGAYVVSWEDANTVYYRYTRLGKGSSNTFIISYPKNEEEKYNDIIEHLCNTFKSSNLEMSY